MSEKNNLDWKNYEAITKYIYETLGEQSGVKIIGYGSMCKAVGKSGLSHQIDVITSHSDGIHAYKTAIECKYWKDKINKDIVMKLAETIEDTGINKGIIVSRSGFTQDGIEFAKYRNIGLVELREFEEKDSQDAPKEIEIGTLELNIKVIIKRPKIIIIDLGNDRKLEIKDEFDYFNFVLELRDGKQVKFYDYVLDFRNHINAINKIREVITKSYQVTGGSLINLVTKDILNLDEIILTGQLIEIDASRNLKFNLVDKVWLIMKSIFDKRVFTFSENGIIVEKK